MLQVDIWDRCAAPPHAKYFALKYFLFMLEAVAADAGGNVERTCDLIKIILFNIIWILDFVHIEIGDNPSAIALF